MDWATFSHATSTDVYLGWIRNHDVFLISLVAAIGLAWKFALIILRARARRTESTEDDARVEALAQDVERFYDEVKGMIPSSIKPPGIRGGKPVH